MSAAGTVVGFVAGGVGAFASVLLRPRRELVPVVKNPGSPGRQVGPTLPPLKADAVVEEQHRDELTMTDHPVEVGTVITDHAFMLPATLTLTYGWAAGSLQGFALPSSTPDPDFLRGIYERLRQFQSERLLLDVYTGKRLYKNMLIRQISFTTTKESEHDLIVRAELREVKFAKTREVSISDPSVQQNQETTAAVVNSGPQPLGDDSNFRGPPP